MSADRPGGTLTYNRIPQEHWVAFFDDFSRDKVGQPVTVELETPGQGRHDLARDSALVGITASTEHGVQSTIEIILGPSLAGHQSHTVERPRRVTVIPGQEREVYSMEIESETGEIVVVRWREALPEQATNKPR